MKSFKQFIFEDVFDHVESIYKKDKKRVKSASQVKDYISKVTRTFDWSDLRRLYRDQDIEWFILDDVDVSKLDIQDEDLVSHEIGDKPFSSDNPIVIDSRYWVIDGRHRAVSAKMKREKTIKAWIPAQLHQSIG